LNARLLGLRLAKVEGHAERLVQGNDWQKTALDVQDVLHKERPLGTEQGSKTKKKTN
jgi:hypothetical protein